MRHSLKRCGFAVLLATIGWCVPGKAGNAVFTGTFEGSGRACYGKLAIGEKTLSWKTSWSACRMLPYDVLESRDLKNEKHFTYLLKKRNKECLFSVVSLDHGDSSNPGIDWHATGYLTLDDFKAASVENSTSCYLVRLK